MYTLRVSTAASRFTAMNNLSWEGKTGRQLLQGKLVLKLSGPQQLNHRSLNWIEETQMHAVHLHGIYKTGQLTHDQNNRHLTDPGDAL